MLRLALDGKNTRLVLQNSDDVALFNQAGLIASERVRMIPGAGVNCSRFSVGGKRLEGQSLRVLLAARLLWDKGLAEYVAAARLLKAQGRLVHFLLAGSADPGNPASATVETVQRWVNEGLIDLLGHVADMPALLATVHVVVAHGLSRRAADDAHEGAACSLPLITTDTPGCREVVTHEVDGLLVPVRDADALARAIARLDDDPILAARLGEAARAKVLAQFDERIVIEQTLAVYQELLPQAASSVVAGQPR